MRALTWPASGMLAMICLGCHTGAAVRGGTPPVSCKPAYATEQDARWRGPNLDRAASGAGLRPLREAALPDGANEVRLWYWAAFQSEHRLLRIRVHGDAVDGELIWVWAVWPDGRPQGMLPVTPPGRCRPGVEPQPGYALCAAALERRVSWPAVLRELETAQVWTLPDESEVPRQNDIVDGRGIMVEVRRNGCYRLYGYFNPEMEPRPEYQHAVALLRAFGRVGQAWTDNGG